MLQLQHNKEMQCAKVEPHVLVSSRGTIRCIVPITSDDAPEHLTFRENSVKFRDCTDWLQPWHRPVQGSPEGDPHDK